MQSIQPLKCRYLMIKKLNDWSLNKIVEIQKAIDNFYDILF